MNFSDGDILIKKAIEQNHRDQMFQLWVSIYPHMQNPPSFENFYKPNNQPRSKSNLSKEEIIARAERIRKADRGEGK